MSVSFLESSMSPELTAELDDLSKSCRLMIESRKMRTEQMKSQLADKDRSLIEAINLYDSAMTSVERSVVDGLTELATKLSVELMSMKDTLESQAREIRMEEKSRFDELCEGRKQYETELIIPQIIDKARVARAEVLNLSHSLHNLEGEERSRLEQERQRIEQEIETLKSDQAKEAHQISFGNEQLKYQADQDKQELRKLRKNTVQLHSIRNILREEVKLAEDRARMQTTKLERECASLRASIDHLTKKIRNMESINARKYERIRDSNHREIRQLGDRLKRDISNMYRDMFQVDWELAEEPIEDITASERTQDVTAVTPPRFSEARIREVLDLLKVELEFLVDPATPEPDKLQVILGHLGVRNSTDLDSLVSCFDDGNLHVQQSNVLEIVQTFLNRERLPESNKGKPNNESEDKEHTTKLWKKLANPVCQSQIHELETILALLRELFRLSSANYCNS